MGNPIVQYESGQTVYPFEEMTDSGDLTKFAASFAPLSQVSGFASVVAPYGLLTGGAITPAAANLIDVAALTVMAPGMTGADADGVVSVGADAGVTVTRGITTDTHMINSVTVTSAGIIAVIAGTDNTAFSEVRGVAGGPPFIPVGSIEIGQIRMTSVTSAVVLAAEVQTVPNLHTERADFPQPDTNAATGEVTFSAALPSIHTGSIPKKVYIKGATPIFAPVPKASDWVPAEATYSISSTDTYDGPVGSSSSALGQASFNAILANGITDNFIPLAGESLWFEFRPDRDLLLPKQLTLGLFGIARSFPAGGGAVTAACTVTPANASLDVAS